MSQINNQSELAAVYATTEFVRTVEIVSRLDVLFRSEKLEQQNKQAAAKHLQMIALMLSRNQLKN